MIIKAKTWLALTHEEKSIYLNHLTKRDGKLLIDRMFTLKTEQLVQP